LLRDVTTRLDKPARLILPALLCMASLAGALAQATSDDPAQPAAQPATAADMQPSFHQLLDARQYELAAAEGQRIVDAASRRPEAGEELQIALMNLAVAQYFSGDYLGAEASYLRVIELVEASGRLTTPRLARAEAGLAATYHAGKRYDLAVEHFDRAVLLSRRSEGLFNEAQLPLLQKYADSLTEVGRLEDALKAQRYSLRVVERKYGAVSLRYATQLESVARWFSRIGSYDASRAALRRAIDIIEAAKGADAPELIGPLGALADCNRRQLLDPLQRDLPSADDQRRSMFHDPMAPLGSSVSASAINTEGLKALERAVAIASSRSDPSPVQLADVRTQLGDWFQSQKQFDRALPQYQLAWRSATGQSVDGKPLTERLFGRPVLLHYEPPPSWDRYSGRPPGETTVRNAAVEFTVSPQGRVVDPKVVADGGDPKLGSLTEKAAQSARYRPRLDKGEPVETPGIRLDQPFYVLVEDAPAAEPAGEPATAPAEAQPPGT
jgi:tetratricopeptide (TPR) repeat protein